MASIGIPIHPVSSQEAGVLGISDAFRIAEPHTGVTFEFYVAMVTIPPCEPSHTDIERLGHVVLCSPKRAETEAFLTRELNFRISDRIGEVVTFMRCFPNPYHHSFGVGGGPAPAFAHLNFMVTNFDDIGRANNRMKKYGVKVVYGPGRHPTSDSVFFYFLDPDGLTLEYSFGWSSFRNIMLARKGIFRLCRSRLICGGGVPDAEFCRPVPLEFLTAQAPATAEE